jgi:predicted nucleic acid-binding protein
MIILDTNVLSETLRPTPSTSVLEWMRSEPASALFTTAITESELLYGIALLAEGGRRLSLETIRWGFCWLPVGIDRSLDLIRRRRRALSPLSIAVRVR